MEIDQTLDLRHDTILDKIVLVAAVGLFALTIVLATTQVLVRQFNVPIDATWTEPLARYVLIVATYFGAAMATRNREHIRMVYLLDKLEEYYPAVRSRFDLFSSIVVIGFLLFTLWGTFPATIANWSSEMGGIRFVTSGMLYLGISLGLALMLVFESIHLYEDHVAKWFDLSSTEDGRWN